MRRFCFIQDLIKRKHEHGKGGASGQKVRHRFSQENGEDLILEEQGKDADHGDKEDDLPQQGQEQRDLSLAESDKGPLAAGLHAVDKASGHIDPKGP